MRRTPAYTLTSLSTVNMSLNDPSTGQGIALVDATMQGSPQAPSPSPSPPPLDPRVDFIAGTVAGKLYSQAFSSLSEYIQYL